MKYQWKQKIEYVMLALIFAAMIQSIFAGFYIRQYHWVLVVAGAFVLLSSCILIDYIRCANSMLYFRDCWIIIDKTRDVNQWISDYQ